MEQRPITDPQPLPPEASVDERGVDRSQIRAFLALTPRERLRRSLRQAAFFRRVWRLNGIELANLDELAKRSS